jgi:hypothetical protein
MPSHSPAVGYYVWIDVVMLRQCAHIDQAPVDLTVLNRLLNVIGRTLVLLDPEALVLKRTWCCYEVDADYLMALYSVEDGVLILAGYL